MSLKVTAIAMRNPAHARPPTRAVGGRAGAPGASAYTLALRNGFQGTDQEWLESLQGAAGLPDIIDGGNF